MAVDRMLYVAMKGAAEMMNAQATNMNNLANVNTVGFRAELENLTAASISSPNTLATRTYVVNKESNSDYSFGGLITTGNPLDVAIRGEGWFAVQTKSGEKYTRAGNFILGANGELMNSKGDAVLGTGGPISLPPHSHFEIGGDGTISVKPIGQDSAVIVDRLKLVKPDLSNFQRDLTGYFQSKTGILPADTTVTVQSGALEGSNVNPVEALVNVMSLVQEYEMNVKLMKTAEDNSRTSAQIMQVS